MNELTHFSEILNHSIQANTAPAFQLELAKNSLKIFKETTLPHRRQEDWKYTNLNHLKEKKYQHVSSSIDTKEIIKDERFRNLIFINGVYQEDISDQKNILIKELKHLSQSEFSEFQSEHYFSSGILNSLAGANCFNGYKIEFPKDYHSDKPIHISHHFTQDQSFENYNHFLKFGEKAKVKIIESFHSTLETFVNFNSKIKVMAHASIEHAQLQDLNEHSTFTQEHSALVATHAKYNHVAIHTGGLLGRSNLYFDLQAENAFAGVHGLYALSGKQHHDTLSYIKHSSPRSYSDQLYKGILKDSSRGIFTGRIRVEKDAQEVSAKQLNKNLLLSDKAHANSRPQMEIYADDVKCAHGSTTGQLSQDELFYFESRGISAEKARLLLANAFSLDVLLKIENLTIRDYLSEHLKQKHVVGAL